MPVSRSILCVLITLFAWPRTALPQSVATAGQTIQTPPGATLVLPPGGTLTTIRSDADGTWVQVPPGTALVLPASATQNAPPPVAVISTPAASRTAAPTPPASGGSAAAPPQNTVLSELGPVTEVTFGSSPAPTSLAAGSRATFRFAIPTPQGTQTVTEGEVTVTITEAVKSAQVTFTSGEGETTTVQSGSASSASATFTFERPGAYYVSASGTVTMSRFVTTAYPVKTPVYGFDPICQCQAVVGTVTESIRYETREEVHQRPTVTMAHQVVVRVVAKN